MTLNVGETGTSVWRYLMDVPFRQSYVTVADLRTRYIEAGSPESPKLIMLHGTGGHWEAFCANIGPLSEHYHCYAIDMLGCGFTDKPDQPYEIADYGAHVLAFMEAMQIDHAAFIGVSLGSWVATKLALDHPEKVEKLVLVAPPGLLPSPPDATGAAEARRASASDPSWKNISEIMSKLFYDQSSLMDDLIAVRQRVYSQPNMETIMPRMLTLFDPDVRVRNNLTEEQWRSITTPTLVIAHVDAPDLYLTSAIEVSKLLPAAKRLDMHETSHWSQFEQPNVFNKAALAFLSGS